MFIFAKTYENIKTHGLNFPIEDAFWYNNNCAIIADGVTKDPIGISDFSGVNPLKFIEAYPNPSGASIAANIATETFSKNLNYKLEDRLAICNQAIHAINNREIDYLQNDFDSTVACSVEINNLTLKYSYICDCGIIIYNKNGAITFQTNDDKKLYSDKYIDEYMDSKGLTRNVPQARYNIRKYFRNNAYNIKDGKCVSYGCLTGEDSAIQFIRKGKVELSQGDFVILYSDGFSEFLRDQDFIGHIIDFNEKNFNNFINNKSEADYQKYGHEKTIVIFNIS